MALDSRFTGREEKRFPVMIEAKLAPAESAGVERQEKAQVENISASGARVYARGDWQLGEQVEITSALGEGPLRGEVIYRQKLVDGRFVVGLTFWRSPVLSSILERLKNILR